MAKTAKIIKLDCFFGVYTMHVFGSVHVYKAIPELIHRLVEFSCA